MRRLRVGDRVKLKLKKLSDRCLHSIHNKWLEYNKTYTIDNLCGCKTTCDDNREIHFTVGGYFCEENDLELVKELHSEIEYLDAFQDNFKDGI